MQWLKHFFFPHEGNNHHPHIWRKPAVVSIITIAILTELCVLLITTYISTSNSFLASVLPAVVAQLTNEERKSGGVSALSTNPLLVTAAQLKANDMALRGYFSHDTPDGKKPWYWLDQAGYTYTSAGENLAVRFSDSKEVVQAWMNSPSHRANILKEKYTEIGIATAEGVYKGKNAIFVVQFFGTPLTIASTTPVLATAENVEESKTTTEKSTEQDNATVAGAATQQNIAIPETASAIAASPVSTVTYIYTILLTLIILSLILLVVFGRKTHPRLILLAFLVLLFLIGIVMFNKQVFIDILTISTTAYTF